MSDHDAIAFGVLPLQISVSELRSVLASCGLTPSTGDTHHVRVLECEHFVFQEDGNGSYHLSADAVTVEALLADAARVSQALTGRRVQHSFEVYDHDDRLVRIFSFPGQGGLA